MKTVIVIFVVALAITHAPVYAQSIIFVGQSELTVSGPQYGLAFGYDFKSQWGGGAFYQSEIKRSHEVIVPNSLYGAYLQIPLVKTDRIVFFARLRSGLSNEKFLVVLPGLETRVKMFRRTGCAFEMSMRMGYPSLSGKIFTTIF